MNTETGTDSTVAVVLQRVMNICKDGADGYETAALCTADKTLKAFFLHLAAQRTGFVERLKNESLRAGYDLQTAGTVSGLFHRFWIRVKVLLSRRGDERVVEESIMGEKVAVSIYNEAINVRQMPSHLNNLLEEQQYFIKAAIGQLFELDRDMVYI